MKEQINRISYISYLMRLAEEQIKKPEPLSSASILILHDALDSFFQEAFSFLGLTKNTNRKYYLKDYSQQVNEKLKETISEINISFISNLNTSRNSLKHSTIFISKTDINSYYNNTLSLFIDATPKIFNHLKFRDCNLADLVPNTTLQKYLKDAFVFNNNKCYYKAFVKLKLCFAEISKIVNQLFHYTEKPVSIDWCSKGFSSSDYDIGGCEEGRPIYTHEDEKLLKLMEVAGSVEAVEENLIDVIEEMQRQFNIEFSIIYNRLFLSNIGVDLKEINQLINELRQIEIIKEESVLSITLNEEKIPIEVFFENETTQEYNDKYNDEKFHSCFNILVDISLKI